MSTDAQGEDNSSIRAIRKAISRPNKLFRMEPPYDRVAILEAQVKKLQEKVSENASAQVKLRHLTDLQDLEKREWKESKRALEDRLTRTRQECQDLREEVKLEHKEKEPSILHRSLSSQSLPVQFSSWEEGLHSVSSQPSSPPSLLNYPLYTHKKPTTTTTTTLVSSYTTPMANSTLLGHAHISGSTSSLGSTKSAQERISRSKRDVDPLTLPKYQRYYPHIATTPPYLHGEKVGLERPAHKFITGRINGYSSSLGERPSSPRTSHDHRNSTANDSTSTVTNLTMTSPDIELQRSKLKIKQLQKEVLLIEQQLSDKTRSAEGHVEELMLLRTELAQEKASLAIVKQEVNDRATREVVMSRTTHARQIQEVELKLNQKEREKDKMDREMMEIKNKMKGSESACSKLKEKIKELEGKFDQERRHHLETVGNLTAKIKDGTTHVSQLEDVLHHYKMEIEDHVIQVEEGSTQYKTQIRQMMHEVKRMTEELKRKEIELVRKSNLSSRLQQEVDKLKAELQEGHTSWEGRNKDLKRRLERSEEARENLLGELTELTRKLTQHSAQIQGQMGAIAELERCGLEVQRLRDAIKKETGDRQKLELELRRCKVEFEKMESLYKETLAQKEFTEKIWHEERNGREACEREGEELRKEVEKLSEDMKACHGQLQSEMERREEKERNDDNTLTHLQQELSKRTQQVLEMDRLLQSHQAETTARRLQLERTLCQRQGEVKARTQEVEDLSLLTRDNKATIEDLREQLVKTKEDQKNLFSGSQAQLLAQSSKVTDLEKKLKNAELSIQEKSVEVVKLGAELERVEEKGKQLRMNNEELQGKIQQLTQHNDSLNAAHHSEIHRLKEIHASQLLSRERHTNSSQLQLQQLLQQEKLRQQELSRCRTQVVSLSAELSAEKIVAQETREQVVVARAEVHRYKTQVAKLKESLLIYQAMTGQHHQRTMGTLATPTIAGGARTSDDVTDNSATLPQQHHSNTTTTTMTPDLTKGGIISI